MKPRIALDTNVVRDAFEGSLDVTVLQRARDAGISLQIADGAILELTNQLLRGSLSWSNWMARKKAVAEALDTDSPIALGGTAGLAASGVRYAGGSFSDPVVATKENMECWQSMLDSRRPEEFGNIGVMKLRRDDVSRAVDDFGGKHVAHLRELRSVPLCQDDTDAQARSINDVQEVQLVENLVAGVFRQIDNLTVGTEPPLSARLDAFVRATCLLDIRAFRAGPKFNAEKRANDAFDTELLKYFGMGFGVCTSEKRFPKLLKACGTSQIAGLVAPAQLMTFGPGFPPWN